MTHFTVDNFSKLLERFRQIQRGENLRNESFQGSFLRLKLDFERFLSEAGERVPVEAPGFNIFYLLGVTRDEVRTHSRFLAELIKPSGSHGQGNLFLKKLLEYCESKYKTFPRMQYDKELEHWNAFTEETVNTGRLDILVSNSMLGNLIVIENKVDAFEQNEQLKRYKHWMDNQTMEYKTQALIFLTIRGQKPTTNLNSEIYTLSYRHDIVNWLQDALIEIQAPVVTETVRQYIDVVKRL